ncbi:hypothetical protein [Nostoc sp. 'Peltigera malacea cyanobiont' DB3992]|uniref:hypothetical protein n=1 Tax=Nostoc sp. 'Peltigera malacea cyanobiont' DB3992 TaxID=1206980 RepID=UPI00117EA204|nr:hypothetical protein [Nostoc sp. 'Peltigera malacea cyanobiont' DB3992]
MKNQSDRLPEIPNQRSYQRVALHGMMKPSHSLRFPLRKLARGKASDAFGGLRLRTPTTGKQLYI